MTGNTPPKKLVLVVDDDPGIGNVLGIALRVLGYDVMITTAGAEAIELARTQAPDIIMPKVDGFQVLENLQRHSDLPVIAFIARAGNAKKALDLGVAEFLGKPFMSMSW